MSKLAQHFRFHPCLCPEDFIAVGAQNEEGYPAAYIHHFILPSVKPVWPPDFRVHICYIPTTFEAYAFTTGTEPLSEFGSEWVLGLLTSKQDFPGGFVGSDMEFLSLLSTLITNIPIAGTRMIAFADTPIEPQSKRYRVDETVPVDPFKEVRPCPYTAIPGAVIGHGDIEFYGGRGENRFWLAEVSTPINPDVTSGFGRLHRRIEWFMHFYIDALSPIVLESRWRCFVVFRFFTDPSPLTIISEDLRHHQRTKVVPEQGEISSDLAHVPPHLHHMEPFQVVKDELLNEVINNPNQPIEVLGLVTAFQFFSIPKDRIRISQFFLFPNRQRQGLGRQVLHVLMDVLTGDKNIQQVSVEEPAPVFQRLRDTVSLERALNHNLITVECFYPPAETNSDISSEILTNWSKYDAVLKRLMLETRNQRRRLRLLLALARIMPTSVLMVSDNREHGMDYLASFGEWRNFEKANSEITRWRVAEKHRLRKESLDWYSQPQMDVRMVQGALEEEWSALFISLCQTIRKLRLLHPLQDSTLRVV